jgi:predicted secreted Zn-dependent protease
MDKHGLPSKKRQIVYAIHVGGPIWTYKYYGINGQCFVTEPWVVLNSTITYPRWLDQRKASDSTKRWWKSLLESLKKHEETHRKNAADATIEISNLLNGYEGPCKTLVSDISVKTKAILADLEKKQDKFDDKEQNEGALCR